MKDDRFDKMDEKLESKSWDFRELEDGEEQRERLRQKRNVSNERSEGTMPVDETDQDKVLPETG